MLFRSNDTATTEIYTAQYTLSTRRSSDLGTFDDVGHQVPQYWGPVVAGEIPIERGEIELQAGFLFGFGANEADNQLRLTAEWDFF